MPSASEQQHSCCVRGCGAASLPEAARRKLRWRPVHDSAAKDLRQVYFLDVVVQSGDTSLEVCNPCYMSVVTVKRDSTSLVSTQMLALAACEYFLQHVLPVLPVSVCDDGES
jgi:hypothetical protein